MKEFEDYLKKIEQVFEDNKQYKYEAYSFVMSALHHTVGKLDKPRHISGKELLNGIREFALEQYGPMTRTVLGHWGVNETLDFGKIVFALVEVGILRKQAEDKLDDFKDIYDFEEAFVKSYSFEENMEKDV